MVNREWRIDGMFRFKSAAVAQVAALAVATALAPSIHDSPFTIYDERAKETIAFIPTGIASSLKSKSGAWRFGYFSIPFGFTPMK